MFPKIILENITGTYLKDFNFDSFCLPVILILCVYITLDVLGLEIFKKFYYGLSA